MDIIKFTDNPNDLSNTNDMNEFINKFLISMTNGLHFLKKQGYFAVVAGDLSQQRGCAFRFLSYVCYKKEFQMQNEGYYCKKYRR